MVTLVTGRFVEKTELGWMGDLFDLFLINRTKQQLLQQKHYYEVQGLLRLKHCEFLLAGAF